MHLTPIAGRNYRCAGCHSFNCNILLLVLSFLSFLGQGTALSLENIPKFPSLGDLDSDCSAVYTQTIPDCLAQDFGQGAQSCSTQCVDGLGPIMSLFSQQCDLTKISGASALENLQPDQIVTYLCNNAENSPALVAATTATPSLLTTVQTLVTTQVILYTPTLSSPSPPPSTADSPQTVTSIRTSTVTANPALASYSSGLSSYSSMLSMMSEMSMMSMSMTTIIATTTQTQVLPLPDSVSSASGASFPSPYAAASSSSPTVPPGMAAMPKSAMRLSAGAIAGIVIGAVSLVALILIGAYLFIRRRRKRQREQQQANTSGVDPNAAEYFGPNPTNPFMSVRRNAPRIPRPDTGQWDWAAAVVAPSRNTSTSSRRNAVAAGPIPRNPFEDVSSSGSERSLGSDSQSMESEEWSQVSPRGTRIFDGESVVSRNFSRKGTSSSRSGSQGSRAASKSSRGGEKSTRDEDADLSRKSSVRVRRSQVELLQRDSLPENLGKLNRWLSLNRERERIGGWPLEATEGEKGTGA
ncbi:hypothetical protein NA57DRAFT_55776 [Rhizodiscina lignyota]|uniref:Extracellular membrane protein CFEM domain-containing protein n=1 Tax=Rhizodiscina lignyota TaxID=1504668 RepID=A0A9P4M9Y2_9PEZI|nr:hypothetical protein NA57DRAFT_55776 [Rhizodiscina lignyota]